MVNEMISKTKQCSPMMKQALGQQWDELPAALKAHYMSDKNGELSECGTMDIDYPGFMQLPLSIMRIFGALVNKREQEVKTQVHRKDKGGQEYWQRKLEFSDGKSVCFNSFVVHAGGNELIEYINSVLGLCMAVSVKEGELHYIGKYYVLKLGGLLLKVPNSLAFGEASIIEVAVDETHFAMDFRIKHPLLGQVFSYAGQFSKDY